jgi:DNA topoisomerase-3
VGKSLVITEKPSVARDIVAALGGFTDRDGYWESDEYVVTFCVGHLLELLAPEDLDPVYKRWTLDTLPILPEEFKVKPKSGVSDRIRIIGKLLKREDVEEVVNACDAGREGELIFREIVEYHQTRKPTRRLWLQSMTRDAIRQGFQELKPGANYDSLSDAAKCRSYSDWLIGMNATRALTRRLQSRRERVAWSAGRVQTPTLAILVGREVEILSHRPRAYWRVEAKFGASGHEYSGNWFDPDFRAPEADEEAKEDRIFDESRANAIAEAVRGREGRARETRKPSRETAPPLFDLTSLQREGNRRFGWSARRTLNAAQRCYETHKLLTYPRTDSRCLPNDYRQTVDNVIQTFSEAGPLQQEARRLAERGLQNTGRTFDDSKVSDHFAIIPTGKLPEQELSGDDARLFDLVSRRFLASFYPPAIWNRVERITEVEGHSFRSRSRTLDEPGWREVMGQAQQEDQALPPLAPGRDEVDGIESRTLEVETRPEETKPPARVTEARLLSLMENAGQAIEDEDLADAMHEKGIGTPATRADIIENLIQKGYVTRLGKALRPTVKGMRLVDSLRRIQVNRLASPELTGELEYQLREVEHGRRSREQFMKDIVEYTTQIVDRTRGFDYDDLYRDDASLGTCPCEKKRPVFEQAWFYRCEPDPNVDPDEDCEFRIWKDKAGRYMDRSTVTELLEKGETRELDGFMSRDGRTYHGVLKLEGKELKLHAVSGLEGERAALPEYEVNDAPLAPCPLDCGSEVIETATHFICRSGAEKAEAHRQAAARAETSAEKKAAREAALADKPCPFVLPRTVCRREIARDEAEGYLKNRRTELLSDFISRFGRPFQAVLFLKENGRHGFEFANRTGTGRKKTTRKKTTRKKTAGKKTARKKTARKKTAGATATRKKAARKKTPRRKASAKS